MYSFQNLYLYIFILNQNPTYTFTCIFIIMYSIDLYPY